MDNRNVKTKDWRHVLAEQKGIFRGRALVGLGSAGLRHAVANPDFSCEVASAAQAGW